MIDTSLTFHLFSNCCSIWQFQLNVHWFFVRINFSTGDIFHQIQQEACCSNFEVFFTLFLAQFSQQKKKFTKAVSEPFARLIIRYSRRLWKVFRKGVSSLLDWSPIQGWWWKGWSYPFGIIWTHFHLLWYGVSVVYLISKFSKNVNFYIRVRRSTLGFPALNLKMSQFSFDFDLILKYNQEIGFFLIKIEELIFS